MKILGTGKAVQSTKVAVIGAGAAGLVAARECLRQGFEVCVFEKSDKVGGVWQYRDEVEDDLLGQHPKKPLHGSLYKSLRTNLPRKLMAFRDFPFDAEEGVSQFVSHQRVCKYLEDFADYFKLRPWIEFNASVVSVRSTRGNSWQVISESGSEETFDAVIVANGHFSKPRVPKIACMDRFKGLLMHSHNYRVPDPFKGKRVALLGAAASATDIALELSQVASQVYWCAEKHADNDIEERIVRCGVPTQLDENQMVLADGAVIESLEAFIFCTGYHYVFPFLEEGIIDVVDNWVHPLYLHMIPIHHPTIAILGMLYSIIPFPLMELQSRWFAQSLSGKIPQPSPLAMEDWFQMHRADLQASGRKQRNYHKMGAEQYSYMNRLAQETGSDLLPGWFEPLSDQVRMQRFENPLGYRDEEYTTMD